MSFWSLGVGDWELVKEGVGTVGGLWHRVKQRIDRLHLVHATQRRKCPLAGILGGEKGIEPLTTYDTNKTSKQQ